MAHLAIAKLSDFCTVWFSGSGGHSSFAGTRSNDEEAPKAGHSCGCEHLSVTVHLTGKPDQAEHSGKTVTAEPD